MAIIDLTIQGRALPQAAYGANAIRPDLFWKVIDDIGEIACLGFPALRNVATRLLRFRRERPNGFENIAIMISRHLSTSIKRGFSLEHWRVWRHP
jgi:hypothetical protein